MPKLKFAFCAAGLALALFPPTLPAAIIYVTTLAGSNEVPPTGSTASGTSTVTLNGNSLSVLETFAGLTGGSASAAHIHCCGPAGVNEPVALPFTGFPSTASGAYSMTFDLTMAATYTAAFVTASGGTAAAAEAALIAGLNSGQAYANIHNSQFPGGEIRGQLAVQTPEPTTAGLLLLGLAPLVIRRLRKHF